MYFFNGIGGENRRHAKAQFILACCLTLFACITFFGFIFYRGPIHKDKDGIYRNKSGQVFTERQHDAFEIWQTCFIASFASVIVAGISASRAKKSAPGPDAS